MRFKTTLKWHHKATKYKWYKKWHDFRYAHHFHVATAVFVSLVMLSSAILNLFPSQQRILAANGNWAQTTFDGSTDGTYSNTQAADGNTNLSLLGNAIPSLSNAGGGSWSKRALITITNFQANFETKITLTYDADMQADFDDIRFYDATAGAEIPYWLESKTDSTTAIVWFKTGANNNIYLYYGNSSATSSSNGSNTFLFFDGFDGAALDGTKWTINKQDAHVSYAVSGGSLRTSWTAGTTWEYFIMRSNSAISQPYVLESRQRQEYIGSAGSWVMLHGISADASSAKTTTGNTGVNHQYYNSGNVYGVYVNGTSYQANTADKDTNWHNITFTSKTGDFRHIVDGATKQTQTDAMAVQSHYIYFGDVQATNGPGPSTHLNLDWVKVRSYAATEPTTSLGSEGATGYASSGSFTSLAIPTTVAHQGKVYDWGTLTYTTTLNSQTLTVDVLNGTNDAVLLTNVSSGTDLNLSASTYPSLKVKANLSTANSAATPILSDWSIAYSYDITGPTVPTLSVGTVTSTTIPLSWTDSTDNESGVAGYEVQRAPDNAGAPGAWGDAGSNCNGVLAATSCIDSDLTANTKYWYRVRAKDNVGNYGSYTGENTITIQPDATAGKDAFLNGIVGNTENNYGTSTTSTTNAGANGSILIEFDLSSIPLGSTVYSAELSLYETARSTTTSISAYRILRDWNEGNKNGTAAESSEVDWVHYNHDSGTWTTPGARGSTTDRAAAASATDATFDATVNHFHSWSGAGMVADVQAWVDGTENNGWVLYGDGAYSRLKTSDDAAAASRPKLTITYGANTSATTLSNAPVLNSPTTPTNDARPAISNSSTADSSFANNIVNLYDGATKVATTHANGSGVFSFGENKILNPSFENDTTPNDNKADSWTVSSSAGVEPTYSVVSESYVGSKSQRIQYTGQAGNSNSSISFYQTGQNFLENDTVMGSVLVKGAVSGASVRLGLQAETGSGGYLTFDGAYITPSSSWTAVTKSFNSLPATTGQVKLFIQVLGIDPGDTVDIYLDNAKLDNYKQNLTEGLHNALTAKATNSSGAESAASAAVSITIDTTAPSAPNTRTAAKVTDESGADINDAAWNSHNNGDTVYFAWSGAADPDPASNIKRYWVYFGSNSGAVPRTDGQTTADATASAIKTLSSPVSGTDYYLRIQTEDNAGNISSDGAIPTLFTYKFDNTAPSGPTTVTPNPVGWNTTNSFNFSWTNWTEADSGLSYYLYNRKTSASLDTYEEFDATNRKVTDVTNPINLNSVEALFTGINYIRVYAVDAAGNISSTYASTPYFYSGTVAGPTITASPAFNTTNSFGFTLTAPEGITTAGYYCGVTADINASNSTYINIIDPPASVTINGKTTNVSVNGNETTLSEFAAATQQGINNLYCATQDNMGNIGWANKTSGSFTINTTAPAIPSNLSITDASNRGESIWALTVAWAPISNPGVDFAGYKVYRCVDADCTNNSNYSLRATVTSNIYSEASLDNGKDYYYKVKSTDNVGNLSDYTSSVHRIPTGKYTTPPTYTSNPTASAKALSVTINWTTNRTSNTVVQYGTTNSYGQEASKSTEAVTNHSIEILGLTPGTTYHYRIQSLDADREYDPAAAFSEDYTFTTLAAPGISNVEISEIRLSSAILTWKTTSSATSRIHYGKTTAYGQTYTDNSASQTTTHTVKLENLTDSTTYHFKITGTDVDGNALSSDDYVFTTLTFPKLSSLKVEQVPNTPTSTVEVKFDSNVPTSSQIIVTGKGGKDVAKYDLETTHVVKVTGLADNTQYTISAKGRDQYGNEANAISTTYKTDFDTRPPLVTDITVESSILGYGVDAKGQIVVSWNTDEPATSQIEYGSGIAGNYTSKTQEDTSLTENHVVIISDLKPSSPYHFRVISKDASGNSGISGDNPVLTEQATESVIDLIIKSLQSSIGWIFTAFVRN